MARVTNGSGDSDRSGGKRSSNLAAAKAIKALRSELIERFQFATGEHGMSFSGVRDLYAAGGYPRKLTSKHYSDLYERGDIAERLVEAHPEATWSPGTSIFEDEDPDNVTQWEIDVNGLFTRLDIWNVFKRADILSRIGENGYSVILIGDKSRVPLDQELPPSVDFQSVIYLQPLHQKDAKIVEKDEDVFSERFSLPLWYELDLGKTKSGTLRRLKVHWSRLIHFTEGGLDNPVYGPPALRSIYNRLMDMEKIFTAGSEAAFKRMDPGALFTLKENADLGADPAEEDAAIEEMQKRIDEFYHGMRRYLLADNMDATTLTAPVHNFGSNIDSIIKVVAGARSFPQRKLTGSEEAQLASEQDRSSWQDGVAERRLNVAEPHVREFVNRIGRDRNPEEWDIYWPDKGELNLHEKAELVEMLARANQAQYQADGTILYTSNEIREKVGDGPIEESDLQGSGQGDDNEDGEGGDVVERDENGRVISDNRRSVALRTGKVAALLTTKRAHVARKLKSRGIDPATVLRSTSARNLAPATDRDEQTAVRRIADSSRQSFANAMLSAWSSTFTDDDSETLRLSLDNLERAESFALSKVDEMESLLTTTIIDRLTSIMERSAKSSLRVVTNRGSWSARRKVGRFESDNADNPSRDSAALGHVDRRTRSALKSIMDFNIANPRAIKWARDRAAELITGIGGSTRDAVKSIISDGIREGRAPRVIAREIRERVGLRSDQLETLARFKLTGATDSQIERRAKQLLKQRAELIARTETMRSSNEGLKELWRQAQDSDLLPKDVKREWIATFDERSRDEHEEIDGETVGLDEAFSVGEEPGESPNCRCSQGIA